MVESLSGGIIKEPSVGQKKREDRRKTDPQAMDDNNIKEKRLCRGVRIKMYRRMEGRNLYDCCLGKDPNSYIKDVRFLF